MEDYRSNTAKTRQRTSFFYNNANIEAQDASYKRRKKKFKEHRARFKIMTGHQPWREECFL